MANFLGVFFFAIKKTIQKFELFFNLNFSSVCRYACKLCCYSHDDVKSSSSDFEKLKNRKQNYDRFKIW